MNLKALGEIAHHRMGGTPSTTDLAYWVDGDLPWATPGDLGKEEVLRIHDTARKITAAGLASRNASLFPAGTVLLSTTATIGNIGVATRPIYCNQQITAIVPKDVVLPDYLAYFLLRSKSDLYKLGGTSTATHINQKNLATLAVPVPPLPEQRRIVDLLSRAEGIVRLRREAEKKAAELIPALFLDMFGDPATNPKGWPVTTLGGVLDAADYGSSSKAASDGVGLPMIRMGNVTYEGNLDLSNLKYVDLAAEEIKRYSLRQGDILFNRTNSKELVGKTGLWNGSCEAIVASYFIRLRVKQDVVSPHYLWAFLNAAHMKRVIFDTARGAIGQSNINSKELKAFPLPVPSLPLQEQFAWRCADISGITVQQSSATIKAQAAFDALLATVFNQTA